MDHGAGVGRVVRVAVRCWEVERLRGGGRLGLVYGSAGSKSLRGQEGAEFAE